MSDPDDPIPNAHVPAPLRRRLLLRISLFGVCLGVLLALGGFALYLDAYGQVDRARPAEAIVVLGSRVRPDGRPGNSLTARVQQAVRLYTRGLADRMIFSGGVGGYPPAEAEAAARLAMALGVPRTAILCEPDSHNTRQNARYTAALCAQFHWERVIVVSDPYHLWRVRRNFAHEGLIAFPSPARDCARNQVPRLRVIWAVREALAVVRDAVVAER
jgi:uncharacterized SAM-binding protein YcdF (DUF218 family)